MSPDTLFSMASTLVLPGWLLLVLVPRWRWTQPVAAVCIPVVLSVAYLVLIATHIRASRGGFGSLHAVGVLFENPHLLLAGWIHYLAFDLFIGAWETRDALRRHVPRGAVWPCLFLTFLFGPAGLLSYLVIRFSMGRSLELS